MTISDIRPAPVPIDTLTRNWSFMLVRGLAAIAFGIFCFLWPAVSLLALVFVWGAYLFVDGIGAIIWGTRSGWWLMTLVGIVSVLAGLIAFFWPGITALALLYLIAAWATVRGVSEVAAAIRLRRRIQSEWLLASAGVASVVFGVLVAVFPGAGALSVLWLIGSFALVFGILTVALSMRLRSLQRTIQLHNEEPLVGAGTRRWDEDIR